jgi:uncharacterized membrane protein required for colicin V production
MQLPLSALVSIGWVDVAAFLCIFFGAVMGLVKGLETELPKAAGAVLATVISLHFYKWGGELAHAYLALPVRAGQLLAFLALALLCVVGMSLAAKMVSSLVTVKFVSVISRVGGILAGIAGWTLHVALASYFLLLMPIDFLRRSFSYEKSLSGPFFAQASEKFYHLITAYLPFKGSG